VQSNQTLNQFTSPISLFKGVHLFGYFFSDVANCLGALSRLVAKLVGVHESVVRPKMCVFLFNIKLFGELF